MSLTIPAFARTFAQRLRDQSPDTIETFVQNEIVGGRPAIFSADEDNERFQKTVALGLGIAGAEADILIVGSARTGFSLNPERFLSPFGEKSDIDVAIVHSDLFDDAWRTMLAWDYLTMKNRSRPEKEWLRRRHSEVWSG